ncbi:MAG: DUF2062 domain-containing protein [Candidatus Omnitrophica bacterium]|nr:DUF2062 domain-containing protein [Candidatus Omnitrophota bacterium]
MLSFLNIPLSILSLLEANITPQEIAAGVCLGMFLGFVPLNGPMAWLLIIFFFVFKLNRTSTALSLPVFKLLYIIGISGVTEKIGGYLLITADYLTGFWGFVTGLPVIAYLDLNNTLVAGGLAFSLLLLIPVYMVSARATAVIQRHYNIKIKNTKAVDIAKKISRFKTLTDRVDNIKSKLK